MVKNPRGNKEKKDDEHDDGLDPEQGLPLSMSSALGTHNISTSSTRDSPNSQNLPPNNCNNQHHLYQHHHKAIFATLILLLGMGAAGAFLSIGLSSNKNYMKEQFHYRSTELMRSLETAWGDYETFGLWIHQACRDYDASSRTLTKEAGIGGCTREEFRELYEYIQSVSTFACMQASTCAS